MNHPGVEAEKRVRSRTSFLSLLWLRKKKASVTLQGVLVWVTGSLELPEEDGASLGGGRLIRSSDWDLFS